MEGILMITKSLATHIQSLPINFITIDEDGIYGWCSPPRFSNKHWRYGSKDASGDEAFLISNKICRPPTEMPSSCSVTDFLTDPSVLLLDNELENLPHIVSAEEKQKNQHELIKNCRIIYETIKPYFTNNWWCASSKPPPTQLLEHWATYDEYESTAPWDITENLYQRLLNIMANCNRN